MNTLATPRTLITDQQHIFSEISRIKHVLSQNTKMFYNDMLTVSTQIDAIYDFLSETMHYLEKTTENPNSFPNLPEYMARVRDSDLCYDVNPGFVTFVCREGNMRYPLQTSILRSYPDSALYRMYENPETRRVGGYMYVDQSETIFPYVLDYIQARPVALDTFNDSFFEEFLLSLNKLGIPWNSEMHDRHKDIINTMMINSWTQNEIRFNIDDELYIIRRDDIRKYGLYKSIFNCQLDDRLKYDITNNAFIFSRPMKYFHYVEEYIQAGEVTLQIDDIDKIEEIEEEFIYLNIDSPHIWKPYMMVSLLFKDTRILNNKLMYYISKWFDINKQWKLLYRYVSFFQIIMYIEVQEMDSRPNLSINNAIIKVKPSSSLNLIAVTVYSSLEAITATPGPRSSKTFMILNPTFLYWKILTTSFLLAISPKRILITFSTNSSLDLFLETLKTWISI